MSRQQGDEHAEAGDGEVDVEQPGQQLEGVRRPAPAVGPGAERHVGSLRAILPDRRRAVRIPTARIHPAHRFNIKDTFASRFQSESMVFIT